jgi:uncharacterized membrane protein YraQ (UPF0718 family)
MTLLKMLLVTALQVWDTFRAIWPYLLVSVCISAAMRRYVSAERVNRWLQKYHRTSIIAATGVAISTPLCSCGGGIAVALSMIAVSVPWGPLVAFITASPLTSPDELFYSAGFFGWPFAATYLAAAAIAGITGGVLAHHLESKGWLANQARHIPKKACTGCPPSCNDDTCCSQGDAPAALSTGSVQTKRFQGMGYLREIWLVGRRLLLIFFLASFLGYLLGNLIPATWISTLFGSGTGWSVPLGATLGLPFYLNISSSLPIARAFMAHGATPGAAMAFLLVGAGTSIGAVAGMLTIVRWRVAALVTVTLWTTAVVVGSAYNLLLAARLW